MKNYIVSVLANLFGVHLIVVSLISGLNDDINRTKSRSDEATLASEFHAEELFRAFVIQHNRTYVNDRDELKNRLQIFKQSLKRQASLNAQEKKLGGTTRYGVNQFSDWTPEEFQAFLKKGMKRTQPPYCPVHGPCCHMLVMDHKQSIPGKINWATQGKVTAIKNQGKCGSCWAFSGTEIVETQWAIKTGNLMDLSVQELVDCSEQSGCEGGDTCSALMWLHDYNVTMVEDSEYPYKDASSSCQTETIAKGSGVKIKYPCGCRNVSEKLVMMPLVAFHGTWAVNVDATMWHDYLGGIIQHHCSDRDINHAVQITGYDTTGQVPYWILRNSWGTSFGMEGYLHVAMGKNLCGLARYPTYVVV